MAYEKQSWVNGVSPVSAARLNHIEDGIEAALLKEDADTEYAPVERALPTGGTAGQMPVKTNSGVAWQDAPSGVEVIDNGDGTVAVTDYDLLTKEGAVTGFQSKAPTALAKLRVALMLRDIKPIVFVGCGSSTMNGTNAPTNAQKLQHRLSARFQSAYPLTAGSETAPRSLTDAAAALPLSNGIQFVNAALGGATTATYLTPTKISQIASLNPSVILHMISSNDYASGRSAALFKSTLTSQIDALNTAITGPVVHVLFQPHQRYDSFTQVSPYPAYGQAMAEIAAADPTNVAYIDLSQAFAVLGIPGTDDYGLMEADHVHLGGDGHGFLAEVVYTALMQNITYATPSTALDYAPPPGTTFTWWTSDGFSGADNTDLHLRYSDAASGGTAQQWSVTAAGYLKVVGGKLVRGSNTGAAFARMYQDTSQDYEIGFKFDTLPTVESFITGRRTAAGSTGTSQYRIGVGPAGARLAKTVGGATNVYIGAAHALPSSPDIRLRMFGNLIALVVDGVVLETVTDTDIPVGNYLGLSLGNLATLSIDSMSLRFIT